MFGKKKEEKKELPDLPPMKIGVGLRDTFEEQEPEEEKHALPSFPDSLNGKGFSQAAIKDAVGPEKGGIPEFPEHGEEEKASVVEMEEWKPGEPKGEDSFEMPETPAPVSAPTPERTSLRPVVKSASGMKGPDIFVKISKFHSAKKALGDIREKLEDIEDLIKKIREVKMREEQELGAWEKDMMQLKARMQEVSENIFEKVE